tara:strand:+ start:6515 stop:7297 length:783 start_codon:yes stop_codon:yes gene_type:complete
MLGRKQKEKNENFVNTFDNIESIISKGELDNAIDMTVQIMKKDIGNKKWGVAWSGGKDSVVLDMVCQEIGQFPSCIGMTNELEYPEFMQFVTDYMPNDLKVYTSGHTLKWLSDNLEWLFPKDSQQAAKWFKAIQHKAQNDFFKDKNLDMLLTGRRKLDMNYIGKNQQYKNKSTGVVRYSPLSEWSHELILAAIKYYDLPVSPSYSWKNGWVVGSGCWAARQWTGSTRQGWTEIYEIDPSIVHKASRYIKSAEHYVRNLGI